MSQDFYRRDRRLTRLAMWICFGTAALMVLIAVTAFVIWGTS